ncbi:protein rolling stone-like [Papaver somniferum]|uniref:protein rolling stone-like n=1 Tax=Papaver somniferum TaxID=3469 RepID=UPI000E7058FD|nr:protein rolling stone-like [Papaver somniferum]XP_026460065.1 protein rolling stone-like [Papaver somniferum]
MTVLVPWNDILCFLVVVSSIFLSIWMLLRHEENDGTRKCSTKYESLLIPQPDKDNGNVITSEWTQPNHVVSNQLWTSCWRNLNPVWLLVTRFLSFVIMARVLAWDIQLHGKTVFLYYTKWTFALVVFYFALGTIASAQGCLVNSRKPVNQNNGKNSSVKTSMAESSNKSKTTINFSANKVRATVKVQSYHEQDSIKEIAGFWGYLMQTVYQTCAGAVILTDTIFWFLIVPSLAVAGVEMNLLMGCMHSLNAVFLLIDTALNSLPFPWFRFAYFLLFNCTYGVFLWVLHACGGSWWPYPFLDLSTPWAPLWYFCLALIYFPCYGLYALIVKLKNGAFSKWFPHAFVSIP